MRSLRSVQKEKTQEQTVVNLPVNSTRQSGTPGTGVTRSAESNKIMRFNCYLGVKMFAVFTVIHIWTWIFSALPLIDFSNRGFSVMCGHCFRPLPPATASVTQNTWTSFAVPRWCSCWHLQSSCLTLTSTTVTSSQTERWNSLTSFVIFEVCVLYRWQYKNKSR